jgi:mRNA interferase RelE/StbE
VRVAFKASFARDLRAITDRGLLRRIRTIIGKVEKAASIADVPGSKKLRAEGSFYRIRVGNYRIGLSVENDVAVFVRVLHRREVYRYFP